MGHFYLARQADNGGSAGARRDASRRLVEDFARKSFRA